MKVNLNDNIWIEGFDNESLMLSNKYRLLSCLYDIIYYGKTSEIPKKLAKTCVIINIWEGCIDSYKNYNKSFIPNKADDSTYSTPKASIQSACPQEYCIIYKTK